MRVRGRTMEEKGYKMTRVWCRRVERMLELSEHEGCPYCFDEKKVETASHDDFCDFKPGEDPVNFGFPEDRGRYAR
jgi:hypothetical protein